MLQMYCILISSLKGQNLGRHFKLIMYKGYSIQQFSGHLIVSELPPDVCIYTHQFTEDEEYTKQSVTPDTRKLYKVKSQSFLCA